MTEIKSDVVSINKSAEHIFTFLSNFDNFGKLMPEQVVNWKSTPDSCSFTIKGMADLALKTTEKTEFSKIVWASDGKAPFDFTLSSLLMNQNENQTQAQIVIHADLSPMLKMMALRPLTNFTNLLVNKLKEVIE
jgi:carbon monoxide dehydrogenase subunit G